MSDPIITTTPVPDPQTRASRLELQNLLEGLRMEIQGAKNKLPLDTPAGAQLDVAQQIITRIEERLQIRSDDPQSLNPYFLQ